MLRLRAMHRGVTIGTFIATLVVAATSPAMATTRASRFHPEPCTTAHRTQVTGHVVDGKGHAVAGVSVIAAAAMQDHGGFGMTTVTDRLGQFRFVGLAPGDYWFVGIHGDHPFGITPALPVRDRLEVAITLDLTVLSI